MGHFICFLINYHSILLFIFIIFSKIPPHGILVSLSHKFSYLNTLYPFWFVKQDTKFSSLLFCSSILSASPRASRVVDSHIFFSKPSSSNFLTWASAPSWASVASWTTHSRSPLWQPCFPSLSQCGMCISSNKYIRLAGIFWVSPYSCSSA